MSIKSYLSPKIIKKDSPIGGFGIFAKELIKKDEIFAVKAGDIISIEDFKKLSPLLQSATLQISDEFFMGPVTNEDFCDSMVGVNHSCNPNAGFCGNIIGVAMVDIYPNDEITQDYSIFNTKQFIEFECKCGAHNCRKIITNNDWRDEKLQQKYGSYFSHYLLKKIQNESK